MINIDIPPFVLFIRPFSLFFIHRSVIIHLTCHLENLSKVAL